MRLIYEKVIKSRHTGRWSGRSSPRGQQSTAAWRTSPVPTNLLPDVHSLRTPNDAVVGRQGSELLSWHTDVVASGAHRATGRPTQRRKPPGGRRVRSQRRPTSQDGSSGGTAGPPAAARGTDIANHTIHATVTRRIHMWNLHSCCILLQPSRSLRHTLATLLPSLSLPHTACYTRC